MTLKFKAFRAGYLPSSTVTGNYVINAQTTFTWTGLMAGMRSEQTVSSNNTVSQWKDISGNANHATQATGSS